MTSTLYQSVQVNNVNAIGAEIEGLHPYTEYLVAVRRFCSGELYGRASATGSFTTEAIGELCVCVCVCVCVCTHSCVQLYAVHFI